MDRRGGTGEVVDLVNLDIERKGHVVAHQLEARVPDQMLDIASRAGEEIVGAEHLVAARQQTLAKMRAEKASAAGDENSLVRMHGCPFDSCAAILTA